MTRTISDDISEIKANLNNLIDSFDDFKMEHRELLRRMTEVEVAQARQGEKISNWNLFQVSFSVIVGAIAAYLGVNNK
jgi:hypothetical protein